MATRAERIRQIRAGQRIARASSSSSAAEVAAAGSPGAGRKDRNESETAKAKAGANAAAAMRAKGQRAATYRSLKGGSFEGGDSPSVTSATSREGGGGRAAKLAQLRRSSASARAAARTPPRAGSRSGPGAEKREPEDNPKPGPRLDPEAKPGQDHPSGIPGKGFSPPQENASVARGLRMIRHLEREAEERRSRSQSQSPNRSVRSGGGWSSPAAPPAGGSPGLLPPFSHPRDSPGSGGRGVVGRSPRGTGLLQADPPSSGRTDGDDSGGQIGLAVDEDILILGARAREMKREIERQAEILKQERAIFERDGHFPTQLPPAPHFSPLGQSSPGRPLGQSSPGHSMGQNSPGHHFPTQLPPTPHFSPLSPDQGGRQASSRPVQSPDGGASARSSSFGSPSGMSSPGAVVPPTGWGVPPQPQFSPEECRPQEQPPRAYQDTIDGPFEGAAQRQQNQARPGSDAGGSRGSSYAESSISHITMSTAEASAQPPGGEDPVPLTADRPRGQEEERADSHVSDHPFFPERSNGGGGKGKVPAVDGPAGTADGFQEHSGSDLMFDDPSFSPEVEGDATRSTLGGEDLLEPVGGVGVGNRSPVSPPAKPTSYGNHSNRNAAIRTGSDSPVARPSGRGDKIRPTSNRPSPVYHRPSGPLRREIMSDDDDTLFGGLTDQDDDEDVFDGLYPSPLTSPADSKGSGKASPRLGSAEGSKATPMGLDAYLDPSQQPVLMNPDKALMDDATSIGGTATSFGRYDSTSKEFNRHSLGLNLDFPARDISGHAQDGFDGAREEVGGIGAGASKPHPILIGIKEQDRLRSTSDITSSVVDGAPGKKKASKYDPITSPIVEENEKSMGSDVSTDAEDKSNEDTFDPDENNMKRFEKSSKKKNRRVGKGRAKDSESYSVATGTSSDDETSSFSTKETRKSDKQPAAGDFLTRIACGVMNTLVDNLGSKEDDSEDSSLSGDEDTSEAGRERKSRRRTNGGKQQQTVLSRKEERRWDEWDKKDSAEQAELDAKNARYDAGASGSNLELLEERQRRAQHLERRARAHEKLIHHANSAKSNPPPPPGVEKGGFEQNLNYSPTSSNTENNEPGQVLSWSSSKLKPPNGPRSSRILASQSATLQRQRMETFCVRLLKEGLYLMKMNRDKKWQERYLAVSTEVMWLNKNKDGTFSGDRCYCPQGLLWAKKFKGDHSVTDIDRTGKGGMFMYDLKGASIGNVADFPLTKKQLQGDFKDSVVVILHSQNEGEEREIVLRTRTIEDATFLCGGCTALAAMLTRDAELKKLALKKGGLRGASGLPSFEGMPSPLSPRNTGGQF